MHKSSTPVRLVVRVLVNRDNDVPDSVTLLVGTYPHVRTWIVLVFLLSANDVVLGGDEESVPVDGPTHGMPHPALGWLGPVGPQLGGHAEEGASAAANPVGDEVDAPNNVAVGMDLNDEPLGADVDSVLEPEDAMPQGDASLCSGAVADFQA